jgi:transcriptional regulator with XRE-family HTH domain
MGGINPNKRSQTSGKVKTRKAVELPATLTPKSSGARTGGLPAPVGRALKKLGADLALARRRRHLTQASMAERIQTSVATLRRMEHGDERIPIGVIASACQVLGELEKINGLLDTATDEIGLTLMNQQVPLRVRKKKRVTPESGAL